MQVQFAQAWARLAEDPSQARALLLGDDPDAVLSDGLEEGGLTTLVALTHVLRPVPAAVQPVQKTGEPSTEVVQLAGLTALGALLQNDCFEGLALASSPGQQAGAELVAAIEALPTEFAREAREVILKHL
jgi:hypothetical protein